jgi:hypothetical protein
MNNKTKLDKLENIVFHRNKRKLSLFDKVLFLSVFFLFLFFRPDLVLMVTFLFLVPFIILTNRKSLIKPLALSFLIALCWMIFAKEQYAYNQNFLSFLGINLFAFFAWSLGLFSSYVLYSHYEHKFHYKNFYKRLIIYSFIYWPSLIILETIAYHFIGIQNIQTAIYSGLPVCDCIHAPSWMKIFYFLLGPIYFIIIKISHVKNPHFSLLPI